MGPLTFSRKDKIAVIIAGGLSLAFAYLTMLAGPAWPLLAGVYVFAIIPLTVIYLADQRKLLIWQATIVPFAAYVVAANVHLGGLRPAEGFTVLFGFWGGGTVLSSPVPAYYYLQHARKRRHYRIELLFAGLGFFILLCSLSSDPFITLAVAMIWAFVWLAKCLWDWRFSSDQADFKKTIAIAASVIIVGSSIPAFAIAFFKQRTFELAMRNNHLEVAGWLVGFGADPNALNVYGQTALREAAWDGNTKAVSALLSMGVKPNVQGVREFQGLMPSGTALAVAASASRTEICEMLLRAGADPNQPNAYGETPLLVALSQDGPGCALHLIEGGANVNARDSLGQTPLMLIAAYGVDQDSLARHVLDELLARGADVLAEDNKGQTAEDWATRYHRPQMAARLHDLEKQTQVRP